LQVISELLQAQLGFVHGAGDTEQIDVLLALDAWNCFQVGLECIDSVYAGACDSIARFGGGEGVNAGIDLGGRDNFSLYSVGVRIGEQRWSTFEECSVDRRIERGKTGTHLLPPSAPSRASVR